MNRREDDGKEFWTYLIVVSGTGTIRLRPEELDAATNQSDREVVFCNMLVLSCSPLSTVVVRILESRRGRRARICSCWKND